MNSLLGWLVVNAITVAVMVPLVMLACRCLWRRPASQHLLWAIVLLKIVTPPVVSWKVPGLMFGRENVSPLAEPIRPDLPKPALVDLPEEPDWDALKPRAATKAAVFGPQTTPAADTGWWKPIVIGLWITGGLFWLGRQVRRLRGHARIIRAARPAPAWLEAETRIVAGRMGVRPPRAVIAAGLGSPFVWCVGRPRLVWPAELTDVEVARGALAHELAHLRRGDHWVTWLELAAGAVAWWNPLFYVARRRLRESAEMACDALAVRSAPEQRREYAELLLRLSSGFPASPAPVLGVGAGSHGSFERRLSMILSDRVSGTVSVRGLLLAGLFAVIVLPGCGFEEAQDQAKRALAAEQKARDAQEALEAAKKKDPFAGREDLLPAQKEDPAAPKPKLDKPLPASKTDDLILTRNKRPDLKPGKAADPLAAGPVGEARAPRTGAGGIDLSILDLGERYLQAEANVKIAQGKLKAAMLLAELDANARDANLKKQQVDVAKIEVDRSERQLALVKKFIATTYNHAMGQLEFAVEEYRLVEKDAKAGAISFSQLAAVRARLRDAEGRVRELKDLEEVASK